MLFAGSECNIAALARATAQAIKQILAEGPVILVAYSLGARIALQMLCDGSVRPQKTFLVSGTCGMEDLNVREKRAATDDDLAEQLRKDGLLSFTEDWYSKDMWQDFVAHPRSAFRRFLGIASKMPASFTLYHCKSVGLDFLVERPAPSGLCFWALLQSIKAIWQHIEASCDILYTALALQSVSYRAETLRLHPA